MVSYEITITVTGIEDFLLMQKADPFEAIHVQHFQTAASYS